MLKQIGESQTRSKFFTAVSLYVPSWVKLAGVSAEAAYLTVSVFDAHATDETITEFTRFLREKSNRDSNCFSAVIMIAADGIEQGLSETKDFPLFRGSLTFNQDRKAILPVRVVKIENGKVEPP